MAPPAVPFDAGSAAPGRRREPSQYGPDAPPRGKKSKFKGSEPRGPKGPIRIKPNGRIYSTDEYGEDGGPVEFEGDNFATRAEPTDDDTDA